ncbi:MAG: hypothetical protein AAFV90_06875 [Cyanobacteria bacterium J06634_5]
MSLFKLSTSGAMMLFAAAGLPSAGTSKTIPTSISAPVISSASPQRIRQPDDQKSGLKGGRTIRITDSVVEITGGPNNGTIRIMNPRRPRSIYQHSRQQSHGQQSHGQQSQSSSHRQTHRVDDDYRLTVETTARSLNATLKIDGETIKTLTRASETLTLSPYLSAAGTHTLEIVGTYLPATANVRISLVGPGTQLSQQVSGSGQLRQTLQVSVP